MPQKPHRTRANPLAETRKPEKIAIPEKPVAARLAEIREEIGRLQSNFTQEEQVQFVNCSRGGAFRQGLMPNVLKALNLANEFSRLRHSGKQ